MSIFVNIQIETKVIILLIIVTVFFGCSNQSTFLVVSIRDSQTIVLEDGTIVKLIGVNKVTDKYRQYLLGLEMNYVFLYDENYDAIDEIYEGSIFAYVYDQENNCINNFAEGDMEESSVSSSQIASNPITISQDSSLQGEVKERVSGKEIEKNVKPQSLSELYDRNKNAVFLIAVFHSDTEYSQGSGFFITTEGIGISNYHVFEDGIAGEAYAKTIDDNQYRIGEILQYNEDLDFIIFKVENTHLDFPFLKISSKEPKIGDDVFAIGNPQGLEHTLSKGIVSSYREDDYLIQTTTEITHGSSGGPLFNMTGEVVGITTSGIGEANLNFAINIKILEIDKQSK